MGAEVGGHRPLSVDRKLLAPLRSGRIQPDTSQLLLLVIRFTRPMFAEVP